MSEKFPALVVDKEGLARKLSRKLKAFIAFELIQNAWDEDVEEVLFNASMEGENQCVITIEDDCPEGFKEMESVYTLFRDSKKAPDPTKRGRFELGEKLVIAAAVNVKLVTTKGTVIVRGAERYHTDEKTNRGTVFSARFKMTRQEMDDVLAAVRTMLPPSGVKTTLNGEVLPHREPAAAFEVQLPTEISDEDGYLRRTRRVTTVELHEVREGESASIYEMGIPVVETGDRWHVNVMQKVPLNVDRDNVTPGYLQKVRTAVLNEMHGELRGEEDATEDWVRAAAADPAALPEAVTRVMDERFGKKRVIMDLSDLEANKIAISKGFTVVSSGSLSKGEWGNVRSSGAILPAGKVTPSPKPYSPDGRPENVIPRGEWTDDMHLKVELAQFLCRKLFERDCEVRIVKEPGASWAANYSPGSLALNYGRLGRNWFVRSNWDVEVLNLLIHEFVHHTVSDHLSEDFHRTATRLGAKCVALALEYPQEFRR